MMIFSLPFGSSIANKYEMEHFLVHLTETIHTKFLGLKFEQETSKKKKKIKCHLLLPVSLLWAQDKPEMALLKLVFFGRSHNNP